jgi:acyl-[acyl-carrier-protein]-phospholipid O-acyltransferase/long-chain-fatty-acid--[acyl-carrier-protein] ligase
MNDAPNDAPRTSDSAVITVPASAPPAASVAAAPAARHPSGIASQSFLALFFTQFLGAANDNIFRWLAVPVGILILGEGRAMALGAVLFTLPYLLLANVAGFLADRFDKRQVIVWCKAAEIALALMIAACLFAGSLTGMFFVVFLMGSQSALFGPAKFSSIPELVPTEQISAANGLMGMISVVASAFGTFTGLALFDAYELQLRAALQPGTDRLGSVFTAWPIPAVLIGTAVVGWLVSLRIKRLTPADPGRKFPVNPFRETVYDLKELFRNKPLLRAALGIAFFWMMANLAQCNVMGYGREVFRLSESGIGVLLVVLVAGVAVGSVLAGILSHGHVELGLVPLGTLILIVAAVGLCLTGTVGQLPMPTTGEHTAGEIIWHGSFWFGSAFLFLLGFGAGCFTIPLEAFLQHRSEVRVRGTIIAATNFLAFSLIILSSGVFYIERDLLGFSPATIFLLCGFFSIPVLVYAVWALPQATVRFIVWMLSHSMYRVKVIGHSNLPERGGALLVANHVSWVDGFLLTLASSRPIRLMADTEFFKHSRILTGMARLYGVIPVYTGMGPKGIVGALKTAREAVERGDLVCIFAEGRLTRTGQLQPFQRGLMKVVEGTGRPVVPVYLDQLWGSVFSYHGGKILWKRPRKWPYPVSISFGQPLTDPDNAGAVRQAVQDLGVESVMHREQALYVPARRFVRKCRLAKRRVKVADSSGVELTGGRLLAATIAMKRRMKKSGLLDAGPNVGILLPPSVAAVVTNAAVAMSGRVAVNLNYTLSAGDLNYCIEKSGLKHVLTSRKLMERMKLDLAAEPVFVEDLKDGMTKLDKAVAAVQAYALPMPLLEALHGLRQIRPDDLMAVIFTSGSTGRPKGVMLSQYNVQANIDAVDDLYHLKKKDSLLGVMPFFHSFGYTLSLWLTLTTDMRAAYHYNPIDARTVGELCERHRVSILMGTPTFLRSYLKRCTPEQMKHLELVVCGAEPLPKDLADQFEQKFGVTPTEGYGATELAPLAAANVPQNRTGSATDEGRKFGTVGRAVPGVSVKVVHPETGEVVPNGQEGLLLVSGPNVMRGYLEDPEKTAEVLKEGWYHTGDMARIDEDGFISITGRLSRFSKIGGEMVPHVRIEEELRRAADVDEEGAEVALAVTSVPDERKGERLVVLHKSLNKPIDEILKALEGRHLPNLWLPGRDSFYEVESIPLLGTGKLDLKGIRELAVERAGARESVEA